MVLRDGHHHQYNSRSSSSSSSKKNKAKRIPRRGMGVAKLEKLRIEEQLHQNHSTSASITAPSTIDFFKSAGNDNSEQIKYLSSLGSNELRTMSSFRLMYNKPALMPKPLLSGISIQIEPPSNQNFSMNSSTQHEEKNLVWTDGTNLAWPSHPETHASIPHKAPQFSNQFHKPAQSLSIHRKSPFEFEYKSIAFREGAFGASAVNAATHKMDAGEENDERVDGVDTSLKL